MQSMWKAPGTKRWNGIMINCSQFCFNFAYNVNLRRYNSALTFAFVQLAAFPDQDYSEIRSAQMAATALPNVGYAVAIDLGDPVSPWNSIHPR